MCATALLRGGSPHVERARPARMVEDVDPHRLGSHSKRPGKASGAASLMHRAAARASLGGGPQYGGRLAAAGAAAVLRVQRERRVRRAQRVERLQRAVQSAPHAPRPTPSAAPSHARRSTLSLHPDRPTAAKRATVVRPSPGRRSFFLCDRWLADSCSRSSP